MEDKRLVISHYEVKPLLEARALSEASVETSPDLGKTQVMARLLPTGVLYPNGILLPWENVDYVAKHPGVCFEVTDEKIRPLRLLSPLTNRLVALFPTGKAPTMTLSGIPMHRIQGTDPWRDTQTKIHATRPEGRVLDTCMGLGYTALAASRRSEWVLTLELDPAVVWLAKRNPWSEALFSQRNVAIVVADAAEFIQILPDRYFSVVIHDPPMFSLAGELYSLDFYRQIYRVLRSRGRLFHYVGNPEGKMARNVTRSVIQRLKAAGFPRVRQARSAFGVVAFKSR